MKVRLMLICTVLLLCAPALLAGCSKRAGDDLQPGIIEIEDFAFDESASFLRELESGVLYINYTAKQPYDYGKLLELLQNTYGNSYRMVWSVLFDKFPSEGAAPRYVSEGQFFPTIYHEGIEIANAYIETVALPVLTAQDEAEPGETAEPGEAPESKPAEPAETQIREYLVIVEHYTGEDPLLQGFSRANRFKHGDDGSWVFDSFYGNVNVGGDGINQTYLPLKEDAAAQQGGEAEAPAGQPAVAGLPSLP